MFRFSRTILLAASLMAIPATAKSKAPQISVCDRNVCLVDLRWNVPDGFFGNTATAVTGLLVNNSSYTLVMPSVDFALQSKSFLIGTATAVYSGNVPPGSGWRFRAAFSELDGGPLVTRIESVGLSYTYTKPGQEWRASETLQFDPLFAPYAWHERRAWEKVHGKRQR